MFECVSVLSKLVSFNIYQYFQSNELAICLEKKNGLEAVILYGVWCNVCVIVFFLSPFEVYYNLQAAKMKEKRVKIVFF